ncbi:glucans biosynthesis glucosyltransferase MdoH [Aliirhizobium smilacinae]|uniref:Glucans biosynthesis glucosyltransferase H n=2 Tax=Aliirhizobium smilacinae TaxID=1395944 RepID=A0A5C4XEE3_9HYPH|nr:glucans biosynthesis glucosyltransferase MdoH [Rhizobium smilacinae]
MDLHTSRMDSAATASGGGFERDGVHSGRTPPEHPFRYTGLRVTQRRAIVLILNLATIAALGYGLFRLLSPGGIDVFEAIMLLGFLLAMPWTVLGFWNAIIGLMLQHGPGDPARSVYPFYPQGEYDRPRVLSSRTALTLFLRNEDPLPALARLEAMTASLKATGLERHFRVFVLSDTSDEVVAKVELAGFARFVETVDLAPENRPVYRRRAINTGYKAGNIHDFLDEHGGDYDFFLPLDSDSVMSGDAIVRLAAAMEARPEIGIMQSLVVGTPATSGFARMFQFGMRHGMRAFTMGAAWWNADCGPYWGHNALIRTAAFQGHCRLPVLPGSPPLGGHVLSHDQLEAAYMRRGGYEVRVLPIETQSYEANPPTFPDFAKRDLRWCQGNMQYWRFLFEPRLKLLSRFQVLQAILMYIAPPAWIAATFAAAWKAMSAGFDPTYLQLGLSLFGVIFFMSIAPKLAGMIDVCLTRGAVRSYGGPLRFGLSAIIEILASMLMAPIIAVYVSVFLLGLPFGRCMAWSGQNRDRLGVSFLSALKTMGLQTVIGVSLAVILLFGAGATAFLWALPMVAGLCLAIPFTMLTASKSFGRWTTRLGLFAIPEEGRMPRILSPLVPHAARHWRRPQAAYRSAQREAGVARQVLADSRT